VFFTALFAGLAAGYAMFTVFENVYVTITLAILWALLIFNLDRFIVSTIRKGKSTWAEVKMALPRLLLAILLALVIAKPLELRIFEKEIARELDNQKLGMLKETRSGIDEGFPEIEELESKIASLKSEIDTKRAFRDEKQQEYDAERFGVKTPGTSGIVGLGTNARKKEAQLDDAERDYQETQAANREKMREYEGEIARFNAIKEEEWAKQQVSVDGFDGLAARMDALGTLTQNSVPIYWANLFIVLLFVVIESAPVVVKLMAEKGPYDVLLEKHEQGIYLYADEKWHKTATESKDRLEVFDTLQPEVKDAWIAMKRKEMEGRYGTAL
jgi:uncharacterized membrane protein YwzB